MILVDYSITISPDDKYHVSQWDNVYSYNGQFCTVTVIYAHTMYMVYCDLNDYMLVPSTFWVLKLSCSLCFNTISGLQYIYYVVFVSVEMQSAFCSYRGLVRQTTRWLRIFSVDSLTILMGISPVVMLDIDVYILCCCFHCNCVNIVVQMVWQMLTKREQCFNFQFSSGAWFFANEAERLKHALTFSWHTGL